MGDVVLYLEELEAAATIASCRICHESEFESCKSLEAPCACSGTVKYAHRDCIQRWCDEKGNTVCEICLQKFEPGYTAAPKISQVVEAVATIRGSLEVVPRRGTELQNSTMVMVDDGRQQRMIQTNHSECSSAADHSANFCRTMALFFTAVLLTRHLLAVLTGRPEDYPFTLATVLIIKASGIIVPMFVFIRLITAVQNVIKHTYQESNESSDDETARLEEEDYEEHVHHTVEVQS